jgi:iron complex transport system permease protein
MRKAHWSILLIGTLLVLLLAPSCGAQWFSPTVGLDAAADEVSKAVYFKLRLPRVILAFIAGGALAVSGVAFQALFRNPLASPFTLGVSGGAAVGAALSLFFSLPLTIAGIRSSAVCALLGAIITTGVVWIVAVRNRASTLTILLSGVVLSFIFSSVIMLLQYLGDFGEVFRMTHWMLGSLEVVGFTEVVATLPWVILGVLGLLSDPRALNLITLGEEFAQSRGVAVQSVQLRVLLSVSCIIGGVVSVCGPIGFVGIVVPFLARMVFGYDHRTLLPASILLGGSFLVLCDTAARTLFAPAELPVGVCTALIGGPIFLWMVLRRPYAADRSL